MPYVSDKQRRWAHANKDKLNRQGFDVDEWDEKSKGRNLPESASSKKKKRSHQKKKAAQIAPNWQQDTPIGGSGGTPSQLGGTIQTGGLKNIGLRQPQVNPEDAMTYDVSGSNVADGSSLPGPDDPLFSHLNAIGPGTGKSMVSNPEGYSMSVGKEKYAGLVSLAKDLPRSKQAENKGFLGKMKGWDPTLKATVLGGTAGLGTGALAGGLLGGGGINKPAVAKKLRAKGVPEALINKVVDPSTFGDLTPDDIEALSGYGVDLSELEGGGSKLMGAAKGGLIGGLAGAGLGALAQEVPMQYAPTSMFNKARETIPFIDSASGASSKVRDLIKDQWNNLDRNQQSEYIRKVMPKYPQPAHMFDKVLDLFRR